MAVAIRTWTGGTSDSFNLAANWDPAAVPLDDDELLFYGTPTRNLKSDLQPGAANDNFSAIRIAANFTGEIGASGANNQLEVGAAEVYIDAKNAGNIYLTGKSAAIALDSIYITDTASNATVYLDGFLGNGAGQDLFFVKGNIDIVSGATIQANSDVFISSLHSVTSDVVLAINDADGASTTLTTVRFKVRGGTTTCFAAVPMVTQLLGGTWIQGDEIGSACGNTAGITLRGGGGKFIWNAGTLTTALLFAGLLDASKGPEPRILTTLSMWDNAKVNLNNGLNNITVTNPILIYGGSAAVTVSPGATLAVA